MNPKTHAALESGLLEPGEQILDGGPARCGRLDRLHMEMAERELGGTAGLRAFSRAHRVGALQIAEADWVGTTRALYYVTFHTRVTTLWPWDRVSGVDVLRRSRFGGGTNLALRLESGSTEEFRLNRRAATDFQQVVNEYAPGR